jgi:hypothetical protein
VEAAVAVAFRDGDGADGPRAVGERSRPRPRRARVLRHHPRGGHRRLRDGDAARAGERGPHGAGLLLGPARPRGACGAPGDHDVGRPRPRGAARLAVARIPGPARIRHAGATLGRGAGLRGVAPPLGPRGDGSGRAAQGPSRRRPSPAGAGPRADVGAAGRPRCEGGGGRPDRAPGPGRDRAPVRVGAPGVRAHGPGPRRRRRAPASPSA